MRTNKTIYTNDVTRDYAELNKITLPLNSILIGILLGDGGLYRSSEKANVRFEMSFGQYYKEYAESIGLLLSDYMSNPVKEIEIKGKEKTYTNYRLKTKTLPVFNKYFEMFYSLDPESKKYIKRVPSNINDLMDPIVLAYLIMSDGNFDNSRKRVRIYTNSFSKLEVQNLALSINENLNIYTGVLHDRKDQWILTIGAKYLDLLRDTVKTHFHPSLLYRIGI